MIDEITINGKIITQQNYYDLYYEYVNIKHIVEVKFKTINTNNQFSVIVSDSLFYFRAQRLLMKIYSAKNCTIIIMNSTGMIG